MDSSESAGPAAPWIGISLKTAIDQVTAVAKKKGFAGKAYGAYSLDIDQNLWRVRRVIPADMHAFYLWFDPDLWNAFVSASAGETGKVRDPIAVRPPRLFRIRTPSGELLPVPPEPTADSPPLIPSREPVLVEFADSSNGFTFAYSLGTETPPHGSICLIDATRQSPVTLTGTLASWLARLAVCDGVEPFINQGGLDFAPSEWKEYLETEIFA